MFAPFRGRALLARLHTAAARRRPDEVDINSFLNRISDVIAKSGASKRDRGPRAGPVGSQNKTRTVAQSRTGTRRAPRTGPPGQNRAGAPGAPGSRASPRSNAAATANVQRPRAGNSQAAGVVVRSRVPYRRAGPTMPRPVSGKQLAPRSANEPQWATLDAESPQTDGSGTQRRTRRRARVVRPRTRSLLTTKREVRDLEPLFTPEEAYELLLRNTGTSVQGSVPAPDVSLLGLQEHLCALPFATQARTALLLEHSKDSSNTEEFVASSWFKAHIAGDYSKSMVHGHTPAATAISLNPALGVRAAQSMRARLENSRAF